jgi:CDP-diacylglycerol--glycerol-3-phosphate 3-phosphatidyltransferase
MSLKEASESALDNMLLRTRQARSVSTFLGIVLLVEFFAIGMLQALLQTPGRSWQVALAAEILLFLCTWAWLMANLRLLRIEDAGSVPPSHEGLPPTKGGVLLSLNSANMVTVIRLLSIPVLFQLLWGTTPDSPVFQKVLLIAGLAVAALSDMLDGMLARRLEQETRLGRYLDPMADFALILPLLTVLSWKELLPRWLPGIVGVKVALTIGAVLIYTRKHLAESGLRSSAIGKISVAALMICIVVAALGAVSKDFEAMRGGNGHSALALKGIFTVCGVLVLVSIVEKVFIFGRFMWRGWR